MAKGWRWTAGARRRSMPRGDCVSRIFIGVCNATAEKCLARHDSPLLSRLRRLRPRGVPARGLRWCRCAGGVSSPEQLNSQ